MSQLLANLDAERNLIAALILDAFQRVHTSDVKPEHFYHEAHQIIYAELVKMIDDRQPTDVTVLCDRLHSMDALEYVGGMSYIGNMVINSPGPANAKRYAEIVLDYSIERGLLAASETIREVAEARDGRTTAEKQAEALRVLSEVAESSGTGIDAISATDAAAAAVKYAMARIEREPGQVVGLPCGIGPVDSAIDGFGDGELIVIGGRTSMGKSVLAMQSAMATAERGRHVAYFSFEMPAASLALRGACALGSVNLGHVKAGRMTEEEYHGFVVGNSRFSDLPLSIIDRSGLSVGQIAAACRRMKYRQGLCAVYIDHLHLMPMQGPSKVNAIGEITASLQRLARELNLPVILLAQLNREAAKGNRDGKASPPVLTDLRDSGSIEQDADTVLLIHRAGYYDESANPNEAEIIIAKARNGERQTIRCGWNGPYQRFENFPPDWSPAMKEQAESGWEV